MSFYKGLCIDIGGGYKVTQSWSAIWRYMYVSYHCKTSPHFKDTLVAMSSGFDEKKHSFLGEPAVDGSGPRRKFLMLQCTYGQVLQITASFWMVHRSEGTQAQHNSLICVRVIWSLGILGALVSNNEHNLESSPWLEWQVQLLISYSWV